MSFSTLARRDAEQDIENFKTCIVQREKLFTVIDDLVAKGFDPDAGIMHVFTYGHSMTICLASKTAEDRETAAHVVRDFVAKTGCTLKKEVAHDGMSLKATTQFKDITIEFNDYVPPSCHIVTEEVTIPAQIIVKKRIVCEGNGEKEFEETEKTPPPPPA
jgi:hypothetical protein